MASKRPALIPDAKTSGAKISHRQEMSTPNRWCHYISAPKRIGAQSALSLYPLLFYNKKFEHKVINFCKKKSSSLRLFFVWVPML